jgi:phosphoketolase
VAGDPPLEVMQRLCQKVEIELNINSVITTKGTYSPNMVNAAELIRKGEEVLAKHRQHVQEHFDDLPEVRNWTWSE